MSAKYYGVEKVGETFEYNGKKYKVVDTVGFACVACTQCAFHVNEECCEMGCTPERREDCKDVYYKEVE